MRYIIIAMAISFTACEPPPYPTDRDSEWFTALDDHKTLMKRLDRIEKKIDSLQCGQKGKGE